MSRRADRVKPVGWRAAPKLSGIMLGWDCFERVHSPPEPGSRSTRLVFSLREVQTIRWSRHSARQKTFSLTRPPDARPHRGSVLSLWSTSLGRSSDFAAGQGVGPEWRR
jgi:hypothetical protein